MLNILFRKWRHIVVWALFGFLQSSAIGAAYDENPEGKSTIGIRVDRDVPFHQMGSLKISGDVYRPKSGEGDGKLPIVLMIHGGGWVAGDKWNLADHARELTQHGFIAVSINYRLAPKSQWPAQIDDCRAAVQWIAREAEAWNGDLDRLAVWGYSAGAQLAALLAYDPRPESPPIRCCVLGGTPADLSYIPEDSRVLAGLFGGTRRQFPDRYEQASPITYVGKHCPPSFLFHGTEDILVPYDVARRLYARLEASDIEAEWFEVPKQGHLVTFFHASPRQASIEFLKRHLSNR